MPVTTTTSTTADATADPTPAAGPVGQAPVPPPAPRPTVTAVLVLRDGATWLPETIDGLAEQSRQPDRLLVVDLASTDGGPALVGEHEALRAAIPDLRVRRLADAGLGFESAVDLAVAELGPPSGDPRAEWLWLLRDDNAPAPDALARLVGAIRRSPSVGIAGPKVLDWDRPRRLVEIGYRTTRTGRRLGSTAGAETDQGQYDMRTDVLGVGAAGMLVRRVLFERVGGFGATPARAAAALDLGWRAQLAGERVVVVPSATVRSAHVPYAARRGAPARRGSGMAALWSERSAARRVALTRCSPWVAPLLAVWLVLGSLVSAVGLLLLKRPAHAWLELADLDALIHPWSSLRARWAFRGRRVLRRRDLASLFAGSADALRHTGDRVHEALIPDFGEAPAQRATAAAIESGPVAEEAEDLTTAPDSLVQRMLTHPGVLATGAAAAVAALGFRASLRSGLLDAQSAGLVGGQLSRVTTDSAGLWHAFRDAWHGSGWGGVGESSPLLGVLAALSWLVERLPYVSSGRSPAAVMLAWVLVLGMPAATATAYLAGRVVTGARWPRALAALAWGCSGILAAGIGAGRIGFVLAQVLAPLVLAGLVRSARRDGSFTAAAATALGAGLLGACVPLTLVPVALAALGIVMAGAGLGARLRGLLVLALPLGLQGHWLLTVRDDPARLLAGPGVLDAAPAPQVAWWSLLLGQPDGGGLWAALLAAPVLLLALAALVRPAPSRSALAARLGLAVLGLVGLAWALVARRVVLGAAPSADGALASATAWPGVGLQWLWLAALALALTGSVGLWDRLRQRATVAVRVLVGVGLGLLAIAVVGGAGLLGWSRLDTGVALGRDALPAVAVDQATGPPGARTVVISPTPDLVEFRLAGPEPGSILRDLAAPGAGTDPGLDEVVAAVAAGRVEVAAVAPSSSSAAPATPIDATATVPIGTRLADLGVGFVSLREDAAAELTRTLDAAPGLTRLGSTDGQILWRVQARASATATAEVVAPSRARIVTATGQPSALVPVDGPHGALDADLPAGPAGRSLVVAESPEWTQVAEVRVDGALVPAHTVGGLPAYALPAQASRVSVEVPPTDRQWFLLQLALVGVAVFLAVPFGNRRSRRLS